MADIFSFPNNQSTYVGAEYVMRWLHGRTSGVFGGNGNATVSAVVDNMKVSVAPGSGWLTNAAGNGITWWSEEAVVLDVDLADGTLDRIDRVIVEWETTNYVDLPEIKILKGTASSEPSAPALTNNSTLRQISLARIAVTHGITALSQMNITDERYDSSVCGIVTESVSVDTGDMQTKYEAALAEMRSAIEEAWSGEIPTGSVSMTYTATIPASGWSGSEPSVCEVAVSGLLANDRPIVDLVASSTYATADAQIEGYGAIYKAVASANKLTVYATDTPEVNLPIQIKVVRK